MIRTPAVVFPSKRQAILAEREFPDLQPGQVLVQAAASQVSTGTESFCYRGEFDAGTTWSGWVTYPFYPGYSAVGRVGEVGANVEGFKVGDRVATLGPHCQRFPADVDNIVKLPDGVDDDSALWSTLSFVAQTGVRRAEHALGDTAVVIGLGPLGQLATQFLRVLGLREVLAVDSARWRLDAAMRHGATQTFCGSAADAAEFVREHTQGQLADVIYDVTGHYAVLPMALKLARKFGKVVLMGDCPTPSKQVLTQDVLARQVAIIGTHNVQLPPQYATWTINRQITLFHQYILRGQIRVNDLITHRHKPQEAPKVYESLLESRQDTMGVVFDWR